MNASDQTHPLHRYLPESHGSVTEGIGALSTIVLAILGLAGILTNIVASVATIVIGAVFLAESMLARTAIRTSAEGVRGEVGGGMTAGFFAGIAGIVLGILSFFRPDPGMFMAVALLVYGAALLLSGRTLSRLSLLLSNPQESEAAGSGSVLMGLAVTVLGILAVVGLAPMTLALVGLLCLGAGAFFSGSDSAVQHAH